MQVSYLEWLSQQTQQRQEESLAHMRVCEQLGEARRTDPYGEVAKRLSEEVVAYYTKWAD